MARVVLRRPCAGRSGNRQQPLLAGQATQQPLKLGPGKAPGKRDRGLLVGRDDELVGPSRSPATRRWSRSSTTPCLGGEVRGTGNAPPTKPTTGRARSALAWTGAMYTASPRCWRTPLAPRGCRSPCSSGPGPGPRPSGSSLTFRRCSNRGPRSTGTDAALTTNASPSRRSTVSRRHGRCCRPIPGSKPVQAEPDRSDASKGTLCGSEAREVAAHHLAEEQQEGQPSGGARESNSTLMAGRAKAGRRISAASATRSPQTSSRPRWNRPNLTLAPRTAAMPPVNGQA
jgi:hypothetical protein